MLCTLCIYRLLQRDGLSKEASLRFTSLWVLNPLVIHISTRGSCDSIECFLVFLTLLCLREQSYVRAAVVYGVAVHFRIYPIIYALALVLYCYRSSGSMRVCVRFAVVSACAFSLLFVVFYALYGSEFVECCYLHHLRRIDVKHNYSVFYYPFYLQYSFHSLEWLPHLLLFPVISVRYCGDLPFCLFLLTFLFVAFNKVITAQYFMWWLSLLVLVLPFTSLSAAQWVCLFLVFLGAMNVWNAYAYRLEFNGEGVFVDVWLSCLLFFVVEVMMVAVIVRGYRVKCCVCLMKSCCDVESGV